MSESEARTTRAIEADREAVERLAENIKLTSLNMAIKAAKLKDSDDTRHTIRSKVRELVALSLDAANHVTRALRALDSERIGSGGEAEEYLAELKRMESKITELTREVLQLLTGPDQNIR